MFQSSHYKEIGENGVKQLHPITFIISVTKSHYQSQTTSTTTTFLNISIFLIYEICGLWYYEKTNGLVSEITSKLSKYNQRKPIPIISFWTSVIVHMLW